MRSNAHFRLLRLLRLQPRRPARKCAGRGSAPPRSCAADSAQHAYRAIDRLADAWGSWPRRRVFFEGAIQNLVKCLKHQYRKGLTAYRLKLCTNLCTKNAKSSKLSTSAHGLSRLATVTRDAVQKPRLGK
ncbi:hypothetical protein X979_5909 [Burkholderia pseudomallei MSHR7527]|nr:hypothetical protein X979_5909 [Burkholderia pseudomallei MSHR7527]